LVEKTLRRGQLWPSGGCARAVGKGGRDGYGEGKRLIRKGQGKTQVSPAHTLCALQELEGDFRGGEGGEKGKGRTT